MSTLKKRYKVFKNVQITECKYEGQVVYYAVCSAYTVSSFVHDKTGNCIGECNYAWGGVDSVCKQLTDFETVYCIKDNIWGKPAVDNYQLGK